MLRFHTVLHAKSNTVKFSDKKKIAKMANMSFEVKLQAVSLKFTVTLKFPLNMNDLLVIAANF